MSQIIRMIAAESATSSPKDELELLVSARFTGRLAQAIIDRLYNNYPLLFNSLINAHPRYSGEYSFGIIERAFADYTVATSRFNKGYSRYFMGPADTVYKIKSVDLYLSREWYAITHAKPGMNPNQAAINDLIRVLNNRFQGNFIYVVDDEEHQLWGPSGTL